MGIKGLPRSEDTVDKMKQLTHHGDDQFLAIDAVTSQPLSESPHNRIPSYGAEGRHVESMTQTGTALFGNWRVAAATAPRIAMSGIEASKGNKLAYIRKLLPAWQLGEQSGSGQVADARNRAQKIGLALKIRVLLNKGVQLTFQLTQIAFQKGNVISDMLLHRLRWNISCEAVLLRLKGLLDVIVASYQCQ